MAEKPDWARDSRIFSPGILSVSALARNIRDLLEHRFPLAWVRGEISNLVRAKSGHIYFILKDDAAQLRCVMFRNRCQYLDWEPREGMQVEVNALVTLYEPRGDFQLNIETMRRAGMGALFEAFVELRDRLEKEGLFDVSIKRPIPAFPRAVGIVTSLQAAALRDVLTTLGRRNPAISVLIYPVPVQGAGAAERIAAMLTLAGKRNECDLLILCRGGGSIEDLWAFNDEGLARAIRGCPIPVLTGIGHETDFTIADFVADQRAATPTGAAEMASPPRDALLSRIASLAARLQQRAERDIEDRMQLLDHVSRRLAHPGRRIDAQIAAISQLSARLTQAGIRAVAASRAQFQSLLARRGLRLPQTEELAMTVESMRSRLGRACGSDIETRQTRLTSLAQSLTHLDPDQVLARGYSVVRNVQGLVLLRGRDLGRGDALDITFAEGGAAVRVESSR